MHTKKYRDLLDVCRIDEVAPSFEEGIQELEAGLLVHGPHTDLVPLVTDRHRTEADGRDADACERAEDAIAPESGWGLEGLEE